MRITRLKLKNFGIHTDLDLNMDGAVVGITGENACGKTTILAAINFAFSGRLPKKQEQYVNYYSGAQNGSVRLEFIHHGEKGYIERVVGNKPSRALSWGDRSVLTKSAEVEAQLASILNTDRKVWESAVFVPQGELRNILSPQEAVREELMTKLLGLGFCKEVSDAATRQAKLLEFNLQDLEGAKAEVATMLDSAEKRVAQAQSETWSLKMESKFNDYDLERLNKAIKIKGNLVEYRIDLDAIDQAIGGCRLTVAVNHLPSIESELWQAQTAWQTWRDTEWNPFMELCARKKAQQEHKQNKIRLESKIIELKDSVKLCSAEISALLKVLKWSQGPHGAAEVSKKIQNMHAYAAWKAENEKKCNLKAELEAAKLELQGLQAPDALGETRISSLTSACDRLTDVIGSLDGAFWTWNLLINSLEALPEHSEEGQCLVCGSLADKETLKSKLETHKKEQEERRQSIEALFQQRELLAAELEEVSTRKRNLVDSIKSLETQLLPYKGLEKPEEPLADCGDTSVVIGDLVRVLALVEREAEIDLKIELLETELASIPPMVEEHEVLLEGKKAKLEAKEKELTDVIETLTARKTLATVAAERLKLHAQNREALLQKMKISEELERIELELTNPQLDRGAFPEQMLANCEKEIEKKAEAYRELAAALLEMRKLEQRLEEIRKLEESDALTRNLAFEMKRLKNAFSREGLPRSYIATVHERLADLTQRNLADMDADFSVRAHPDQAVSFQFTRHFGEPVWMSLEEFSGGQSVMLGIAFLLAVQQLIIPELGILVLDEPSLHLHASSAEHLRDLLINYGGMLANTESQILVCDHNPILFGGFSIHHELKPPQ